MSTIKKYAIENYKKFAFMLGTQMGVLKRSAQYFGERDMSKTYGARQNNLMNYFCTGQSAGSGVRSDREKKAKLLYN